MIQESPLEQALRHTHQKVAAVQRCLSACRTEDPVTAAALTVILGDTLRHVDTLEEALIKLGKNRKWNVPNCPPPPLNAREQLYALIQDEQIALSRQAGQIAACRPEECAVLAQVTRDEAIHLRLLRTLYARVAL